MDKISRIMEKLFRNVILVLFGIFTSYLLLTSLFSTCYAGLHQPRAFVSDSPVKVLFVFVLLAGLSFYVHKSTRLRSWLKALEPCQGRVFKWLVAVTALFMVYFVLGTQLEPHGDQLAIFNAAAGLNKYDFSLFAEGTYFDYWPFQSRIVVFLWGFSKLMGNSNYLAFQMLNVAAITGSLIYLVKLWKVSVGVNGIEKNLIFAAMMLFFPYLLYVTYVYGNFIGFVCVIIAVYYEIRYLQEHRLSHLLISAFLCSIGIWLKNTYQVVLVAMIIYLLLDVLKNRKWFSLAGVFLMIFLTGFVGRCSDSVLERHTGLPLSEGSPMTAWITMAFGEDERGVPVTFDGYNIDVYLDNGRDTEAARRASTELLRQRLSGLLEDPMHFVSFMAKKISLQWNEPTFESVVANNRAFPREEEPWLVRKILGDDNRSPLVKYANLFHGLVLMGCVVWVFFKGREEKTEALFPALVFIGGFLLQLFWESLAQYTLIYFLLLIPYAVRGYLSLGRKLASADGKKEAACTLLPLGIVFAVILWVWAADNKLLDNTVKLHMDNEEYTLHLQQVIAEENGKKGVLPDGYYRISPAEDRDLVLQLSGGKVSVGPAEEEYAGIFSLHHEYGYDQLRFKQTQLLFSLNGEPNAGDLMIGADYDNTMWRITENGYGGYYIQYQDNYALTCDRASGRVMIEPFKGGNRQTWNFEQADD